MSATLNDLARETGLSIATISKYINGINVREENKYIIEKAIEKLDYTVNEYARGLKSNKSRTVGVVIPELSNIFVTQIIASLEETLRKKSYSTIVCDCHSEEKLEKEAIRFLLSKRVDGIINMPTTASGAHLTPVMNENIPVVLIDRNIKSLKGNVDSVLIDNENISFKATEHLINNGHKNIGIIVGPSEVYTSELRLKGYKSALEKHGVEINEELICFGDYTTQGGYENTRQLIKNNPEMTALFVTNYEMTIGTIIYANESGIKIPTELSIIGFDSMELAKIIKPNLTIVTQPLEEIGRTCANSILDKMTTTGTRNFSEIMLSPTLLGGDSVLKIN